MGAGKSTVLHLLKNEFHGHVIMADEIGRELMEPGQACFEKITEALNQAQEQFYQQFMPEERNNNER